MLHIIQYDKVKDTLVKYVQQNVLENHETMLNVVKTLQLQEVFCKVNQEIQVVDNIFRILNKSVF